MIATGNIIEAAGGNTIDLSATTASSASANGGNLAIIAGYNFAPATSNGNPTQQTFQLQGPSATGGNVELGHTTIKTGTVNNGNTGGNVTIIASGAAIPSATTNLGTVAIGSIDTTASGQLGKSGSVQIIGQGGVTVTGAITTHGIAGSTDGAVSVASASQTIVNNPNLRILAGELQGGSFIVNQAGGNVSLGSISAGTAAVTLTTGGATGTINATGAIGAGALNLNIGSATVGSLAAPVAMNVSTINVAGSDSNSGKVFVSDNLATVNVGQVTVGTFNLLDNSTATTPLLNVTAANLNSNSITIANSTGTINLTGGNTLSPTADATGKGGTLVLTASAYTGLASASAPLLFSANGTAGTGDGGSVSINVSNTTSTTVLGTGAGNFELSATGVNGGSASLVTTGKLAIVTDGLGNIPTTEINVASSGAVGTQEGNIALSGGSLSWGANATGTGNATVLNVVSGTAANLGTGGSVSVAITGTTPAAVTLGTAAGDIDLTALGANGGSAALSTTGTLNIVTDAAGNVVNNGAFTGSGLNVAPVSATGNGGSIILTANAFAHGVTTGTGSSSVLIINADGAVNGTAGRAGFASLTQTGPGNLVVGTGAGQVELVARGGANTSLTAPTAKTGSGVAIAANGTLIVNPTGIIITASGSNTAGSNVTLQSNSPTIFNYGLATTKNLNGVVGVLNVAGTGTGAFGGINLINVGGEVTNSVAITNVGELTMTAGGTGGVVIAQNIGNVNTASITLSTLGTGNITGTRTILTNATTGLLSVSSAGGTVGPLTFTSAFVDANAPSGTITLTDKDTGVVTIGAVKGATGVNAGANNSFIFNGVGGITTTAPITAGLAVTLKTTSTTKGVIIGGNIDATLPTGVTTITAPDGIVVTAAATDLSGGKAVTLSSTKGGIAVGTIGVVTAPTTFSATAAQTILNTGLVQATTTITERESGTGAFGIIVDGNMETSSSSTTIGGITLSASGTGGVLGLAGNDIGSGRNVNITASKGNIQVGSIGALSKTPQTVILTALDNITNLGAIKATTTVTERNTATTAGIVIGGNISASATTGVVTLTDAGTAGITLLAGAPATTDVSATKSVTLAATKGPITIGSIGTQLTTGLAKVTSLDTLTESGTIAATSSITLAATSTTAGNVTVNNLNTTNGVITVTAAAGKLLVDAGATINAKSTAKATITLENKNTTSGSIEIGSGATISNVGATGTNVNIVIGAVPGSPTGTTLQAKTGTTYTVNGTAVTANPTPPLFFFGLDGITLGSSSTQAISINSLGGGKVIFNTGKETASAITIDGGVAGGKATTITADPPAGFAAPSAAAVSQARAEMMNAITVPVISAPATNNQATGGIATNATTAATPVTAAAGLVNTGAFSSDATTAALANGGSGNAISTSGLVGSLSSSIVDSAEAPTSRTLYGKATTSEMAVAAEECTFNGTSHGIKSEIDAVMVADAEMGLSGGKAVEYSAKGDAASRHVTLRKGNMVVAPKVDTIVETAFGNVTVAAKSMALIMALPSGTAVFNLDDSRKNSVVVNIGNSSVTLAPGRHTTVTSREVASFDMVNAAEGVAYRNVSSKACDGGLQAFSSEFSMTSAIGNVKQLRELFNSNHPEAKRLAGHLVKTTAILTQLQGSGTTGSANAYELYQHPRMTAMGITK